MIKLMSPVSGNSFLHVLACLSSLLVILIPAPAARAQTQQPFLFAYTTVNGQEAVVTFLRDENSGVLTLLPAAPIPFKDQCLPEVIDPQSQFLFGTCGNGLAMYSFDSTTGAVAEIPTSPYAASTNDGTPFYAVTEATGQYVYVVKVTQPDANSYNQFILDKFQIDRNTPTMIPLTSQSQTLPYFGQYGGIYPDPNNHGIAIYTTEHDATMLPGVQVLTLYFITFDPVTGDANVPTTGTTFAGNNASGFAGSPSGDWMALGTSDDGTLTRKQPFGTVNVLSLSTSTFQMTGSSVMQAPPDVWPIDLFSGPAGTLFYVQYIQNSGIGPSPFHIYTTSTLGELPTSPLPYADWNTVLGSVLDPNGPFLYSKDTTTPHPGVLVYMIDPGNGYPSQTGALTSPFGAQYVLQPIFATVGANGGGQNSSGPFLSKNVVSLNFGQITQGQTSSPLTATLSSIGGQAVNFSSIAITGTNAGDFTQTNTCMNPPVLSPQQTCAISVTYHPAGIGTSLATLYITDNAPGNPQSIQLSGTSVAPSSVATFTPTGTFNLPGTVTQGTVAAPQNIVLTNTGNAPLHVTNIVLGGINVNDFSLGTSSCVGTLAANSNCSIPIIFAPLAAGIRSSTVTITDDAAGSPQVIAINGTATPAASINAAAGGSSAVSVSAGQTAQFMLQAMPGTGFNGTLTFTCAGAPQGASCSVPASVAVTNGAAANFTVNVKTSGSNAFLYPAPPQPSLPLFGVRMMLAILLALVLGALLLRLQRLPLAPRRMSVWPAGLASLILLLGISGCGGSGSSMPPPPPVVTPAGMYTIIVTPTATATGSTKPLQLDPIPLTLTVK